MFLTLPTLLTWARIVAIPLIVAVFYWPGLAPQTQNLIATWLFVVFAATDWADGYLARKLNQTSSFGAFLDPVADKFLVCAALLILLQLDGVTYSEIAEIHGMTENHVGVRLTRIRCKLTELLGQKTHELR